MDRFRRFSHIALAAATALTLGLVSCDEDITKPDDPDNELEHKDHDMASRVEITLQKGHFHGANEWHGFEEVHEAKFYDANVQTIVLENSEAGFTFAEGSPKKFVVLGGKNATRPNPIDPASADWKDDTFNFSQVNSGSNPYRLSIRFFAADGDEITSEFGDPVESKIHQFFFLPENIKATKFGVNDKQYTPDYRFIGYYYMDHATWSAEGGDGNLIGLSNPIGLFGVIEFLEPETMFDLHIKLMHASSSQTKLNEKNRLSPFYQISERQAQREDWEDFDYSVPVVVFGDALEDFISEDADFENLSERDKTVVEKLADAFGISEREAYNDLMAEHHAEEHEGHEDHVH